MIINKKTALSLILPVLLVLFASASILMAGNVQNELVIKDWLLLGPNNLYPPVSTNLSEKEVINEVSKINPLKVIDLIPVEGDVVKWPFLYSDTSTWTKSSDAKISFGKFSSDNYKIGYAVTYLNVSDYLKADLKINSTASVKVYYDGKEIIKLANSEQDKNKDSNTSLDLEPGFHSLVFKTIANKKKGKEKWTISASLKTDKAFNINEFVSNTSSKTHYLDYKELLSSPTIRSVDISPDGKLAIIQCVQTDWPDFNRVSCANVVDIANGNLVYRFIGDRIPARFEWSPDSS
ncbi:MAG: hypothetical protein JW737_10265, partial [Acidobacteria bacterium]|nr:hypothetical protein [Acidobacteriota bacterium]